MMLVADRIVFQHAKDLIAEFLIEERRLKAVGIERDPATATRSPLGFCRLKHACAVVFAAIVLAHPEVLNLHHPAPSPAGEARDDGALLVTKDERDVAPIGAAGGGHVVGNKLFFQKRVILSVDMVCDAKGRIFHSELPHNLRAALEASPAHRTFLPLFALLPRSVYAFLVGKKPNGQPPARCNHRGNVSCRKMLRETITYY